MYEEYENSKTLNYPFKTDCVMVSSVATSTRYLQVSPSNSSFYSSQLWLHECQYNCTFQQGTVHRRNEWGKEVISTKPLPFVSVNVLNKGSACAVSRYSLHRTSILCFTLRKASGGSPRLFDLSRCHLLLSGLTTWANGQKSPCKKS